jgi:adenylate kinase family enzyme
MWVAPGLAVVQLDQMLTGAGAGIDKVINFEIADELLLKRITGR